MPPRAARQDPPLQYPGSTRMSGTPASRIRSEQRYSGQQYRSAPQRQPREPWAPHSERQPREPWAPQEQRPSAQSRQQPERWPDEDEAESTAWGFFMWDE